jgi:hypothetical protein
MSKYSRRRANVPPPAATYGHVASSSSSGDGSPWMIATIIAATITTNAMIVALIALRNSFGLWRKNVKAVDPFQAEAIFQ